MGRHTDAQIDRPRRRTRDDRPFYPPQRTLLGPGPSDVHPRVLAAMARGTIGHLDPAFVTLMDEVRAMLQQAFRSSSALTLPISAPGSAGMEGLFREPRGAR